MDAQQLLYRQFIAHFIATTDSQESKQAPPHVMNALLAAPVLPPCAKPITHGTSLLPKQVSWAAGDDVPTPQALNPLPNDTDPLPHADVLIVTWTADEVEALARVFTLHVNPNPNDTSAAAKWYPYARDFATYVPDLRNRPPWNVHPAIGNNRLGSYYLTKVGAKTVLVFKSELHLNQDGSSALAKGHELPLVRLTKQIISEVSPKYYISTGTAGGTQLNHSMGDVVVAVSGIFDCNDPNDFRTAPFNCQTFGNAWWIDAKLFGRAQQLMLPIVEPPIAPPHNGYVQTPPLQAAPTTPTIYPFPNLPIVTTDYFEYGTTTNQLGAKGCAVEMDDALLAMAIGQLPAAQQPKFAFVRNVSDPVLNGNINPWLQVMWALYYYQHFGTLTSFNSALTTWAIVAAAP